MATVAPERPRARAGGEAAARAAVVEHRQRMFVRRLALAETLGAAWSALVPEDPGPGRALGDAFSAWYAYAETEARAARAAAAEDAVTMLDRTLSAFARPALALSGPASALLPEAAARAALQPALSQPIVAYRFRAAQGATDAHTFGLARARRVGATLVVDGTDVATNVAARQSGQFRGWRRVVSPGACGACLAAASGGTRSFGPYGEPFSIHPGCRCTRALLPKGVSDSALEWVPDGEDVFRRMSPQQQADLFKGRGGEAKAALVRDGQVPFDSLIATDDRGRIREATLGALKRRAA